MFILTVYKNIYTIDMRSNVFIHIHVCKEHMQKPGSLIIYAANIKPLIKWVQSALLYICYGTHQ